MMITKRWFALGAMGAMLVAYGVGCGGGGGSGTARAARRARAPADRVTGTAGDFGGQGQAGDFGGQGQAGDNGAARRQRRGRHGRRARPGAAARGRRQPRRRRPRRGRRRPVAAATATRGATGGRGGNRDAGIINRDASVRDLLGNLDVNIAMCAAGVMNGGKCTTNVEACRRGRRPASASAPTPTTARGTASDDAAIARKLTGRAAHSDGASPTTARDQHRAPPVRRTGARGMTAREFLSPPNQGVPVPLKDREIPGVPPRPSW